jgi:hypothetical protein
MNSGPILPFKLWAVYRVKTRIRAITYLKEKRFPPDDSFQPFNLFATLESRYLNKPESIHVGLTTSIIYV